MSSMTPARLPRICLERSRSHFYLIFNICEIIEEKNREIKHYYNRIDLHTIVNDRKNAGIFIILNNHLRFSTFMFR